MVRSKFRVASLTVVVLFAWVAVYPSLSPLRMVAQEKGGATKPEGPAQGKKENRQKVTKLPVTIQAYESVRVFSRVAGFLKKQTVDLGDRVKRGQVLAVVDVPELEAQFTLDSAALMQARARIPQAKARLAGTQAALETAKLQVNQAEAAATSAAAVVRYREKQLRRLKDLFDAKAVDANLLDESKAGYESAVEAEQAARAAAATTKAQVVASTIKIDQAKANLVAAEAGVTVAQAKLDRSKTLLSFATIQSPMDGVITQRGYFPGDFIRSADNRNNDLPLFTVQRTEALRVLVSIPDRDVPFVKVGDPTELEVDAFPGKKWSAKVTRLAAALNPKTGTMRVEIDLPNPGRQILPGMSGTATVVIERPKE